MKLNVNVVNLDAQNHSFGDHTAGKPFTIISATPPFLVSRLDTEHLLHMVHEGNYSRVYIT
jgi:hypothetical protein